MPSIPIYRDHDEAYRADSCRPLAEASQRGELRLAALRHGHYPGKPLPAGALPGLKMAGFWDAPETQQWGLPWHFNEGIELTFLESGNLHFAVDGHDHMLEPDDLTLVRPWQRHRVGNPNILPSRLHWLILDVGVRCPNQTWNWPSWLLLSPPDLEELTNLLRQNERCVYRGVPGIRECFLQISAAVEGGSPANAVSRVAIRINDLFLWLLDSLRNKRLKLDPTLSSSRRTVDLFLTDLRNHPEHLAIDWTADEMAVNCGLQTTQFVHHVRCLTNMSPLRYLNYRRLDHAAKLLKTDRSMPIIDVSLACGFTTSQYFATVFAKRFGVSPTAFRDLPALRIDR